MEKQLQIPFQLEGNTANREVVRSVSTPVSQMYKVALSQIKIRPGFNARIQPEGIPDELWDKILMIPELADGIFASNGPTDPIIGDIYKVDECFYVTDGERRTRALRHLLSTGRDTYPNGEHVDSVMVILNPQKTTDLQRKIKIGTTQSKLDLTPMQWAYYYKSFTGDEYKLTHAQIAELLNISRSKVDQYILATKLPQDVQDDIDTSKKNITTEVNAARKAKADADDEKHEKTPSEQKRDRKKDEEGNLSGDEDDFDQQDNSIKGVSSMGGPKDTSSGAITLPKDSIYKDQEDTAMWKQFINRFQVILDECLIITEGDVEKAQPKLIERLKMEFMLHRK